MQVNPNQPITDLKGGPVKNEDGKTMTISDVVCNALLVPDEQAEAKEQRKRTKLAEQFATAEEEEQMVEVSPKQAERIMNQIEANTPHPLAQTRVYEALYGEEDWDD